MMGCVVTEDYIPVSVNLETEDAAAAVFLAVSHYLAIKDEAKRVTGVELSPAFKLSLENVRNLLYEGQYMSYNRAIKLNEANNGR